MSQVNTEEHSCLTHFPLFHLSTVYTSGSNWSVNNMQKLFVIVKWAVALLFFFSFLQNACRLKNLAAPQHLHERKLQVLCTSNPSYLQCVTVLHLYVKPAGVAVLPIKLKEIKHEACFLQELFHLTACLSVEDLCTCCQSTPGRVSVQLHLVAAMLLVLDDSDERADSK